MENSISDESNAVWYAYYLHTHTAHIQIEPMSNMPIIIIITVVRAFLTLNVVGGSVGGCRWCDGGGGVGRRLFLIAERLLSQKRKTEKERPEYTHC